MKLNLRIHGGKDDGISREIALERILIGTSPAAHLRLSDPSVSWEHAVITVKDGRSWVENLSASGTRLDGVPLATAAPIGFGATLHLSDQVRIIAEIFDDKGKPIRNQQRLLLLALAGASALALLALPLLDSSVVAPSGIRPGEMARAHASLSEKLERLGSDGSVPREIGRAFDEAWRIDCAGDTKGAIGAWSSLLLLLEGTPAPRAWTGGENGTAKSARLLGEYYTSSDVPLRMVVDHDNLRPEREIDALIRFVTLRIGSLTGAHG